MPRALLIVVVLLVGGGAAGAGVAVWQTWFHTETRPAFALPDLEGQERHIEEWDGKLIVLNFWASWCPPCVKEIPVFTALQDDYGSDGVQFLGVAMDQPEDARAFADDLELNYPSLQGVQAALEVMERYGNDRGTLPYTVIIARDGRIVHRFDREVDRATIEPVIREHL